MLPRIFVGRLFVLLFIFFIFVGCTRVVVVKDAPTNNSEQSEPTVPWYSAQADPPWWHVLAKIAYKNGHAGWCPVCGEPVEAQARTPAGPASCRKGHVFTLMGKVMDPRLAKIIREDYSILSGD